MSLMIKSTLLGIGQTATEVDAFVNSSTDSLCVTRFLSSPSGNPVPSRVFHFSHRKSNQLVDAALSGVRELPKTKAEALRFLRVWCEQAAQPLRELDEVFDKNPEAKPTTELLRQIRDAAHRTHKILTGELVA